MCYFIVQDSLQAVSFKKTDLDYESNIVSTYNLINWSKKQSQKNNLCVYI